MSGPTVEWATRAPAPPLAGLVDRYVGYRTAGPLLGLRTLRAPGRLRADEDLLNLQDEQSEPG